ncbi:methyltransferase N6AMT1-like [Oppia nitens]|uniref:methyltransferase N6AMT1-like n=1 Tax=Oppia nitens TaxID=1686743 RepID=UPI0023DC1C57|nr:methyltransferase N6AMT1-like [Oppia nitens]
MSEQSLETPLFPLYLFKDDFESVYEPSEDTFVLMDAIEKDLMIIKEMDPLICVEVGCGSGAVITSVAKCLDPNKRLYFGTDFNGKALLTTQKCGIVNGIDGCIQLVGTDLTQAIEERLKHSVDLLIFNAPYGPTDPQEVGISDISSAWAGGLNGRQVIDRFLRTVPKLLSHNGFCYLIVIKENNINEIKNIMKSLGFEMTVVLERKTYLEIIIALRFKRLPVIV